MSNFIKKLGALGIAGMVMAGSAMPAFAAETDAPDVPEITANITIQGEGKSYAAYRLMDLETALVNGHEDHEGEHQDDCYAYKYSVNQAYNDAIRVVVGPPAGLQLEKYLIEYIGLMNSDPDMVRDFADGVFAKVKDMTPDAVAQNKVFANMPQGWYLIVETETTGEGDTRSLVMLDTAGQQDITVESKEGVPTLTKKIKDTNDTTGTVSGWQDAGDFDIGDDVEFQLTGTLPENINGFNTYKYIFHDKLSVGLTLNADSVKVMAGATELTAADFTVKTSELSDACSFEVAINDVLGLLKNNKMAATDNIIVTYTAKLGENAVTGAAGNDNVAYLEFSSDPYAADNTTKTPDDRVIGFTFKLQVDKTDGKDQPLAGAEFKLQKEIEGAWVDYMEPEIQPTDTQFNFVGLDSGKYKLVETKVPSGYNKADDVIFEVAAAYTTEANNDELALTSLVVKDKRGDVISEGDKATFTADMNSGAMSTIVVNSTGIKLPSTGEDGSYLVYGLGTIAVIGATITSIVAVKNRKREDA